MGWLSSGHMPGAGGASGTFPFTSMCSPEQCFPRDPVQGKGWGHSGWGGARALLPAQVLEAGCIPAIHIPHGAGAGSQHIVIKVRAAAPHLPSSVCHCRVPMGVPCLDKPHVAVDPH